MIRLPACCLLLFLSILSAAQVPANDSGKNDSSLSQLRSRYVAAMGPGISLYNGKAYERYWHGVRGTPFFLSDAFADGTVWYDGNRYDNVPLMYDMSHDELVTRDYSGRSSVILLAERVAGFTISGHRFMRIWADTAQGSLPGTGYYEVLFDNGSIRALAKRKQEIVRLLKTEETYALSGTGDNKFMEFDYYYILLDGKYHTVRGESDLSSLLKDKKAEVRKFLNRKEIQYKKDPAAVIAQTLTYYDQLKKG